MNPLHTLVGFLEWVICPWQGL